MSMEDPRFVIDPVCDPITGDLYENPAQAEAAGVYNWQRRCAPAVIASYGGGYYDSPWWGWNWGGGYWGGRRRGRRWSGGGGHGPRGGGGGGPLGPPYLRSPGLKTSSGGGGTRTLGPPMLRSPNLRQGVNSSTPGKPMQLYTQPQRAAGYRTNVVSYGRPMTAAPMRQRETYVSQPQRMRAAPMRQAYVSVSRPSSYRSSGGRGMKGLGLGQYEFPIVGTIGGGTLIALWFAALYLADQNRRAHES